MRILKEWKSTSAVEVSGYNWKAFSTYALRGPYYTYIFYSIYLLYCEASTNAHLSTCTASSLTVAVAHCSHRRSVDFFCQTVVAIFLLFLFRFNFTSSLLKGVFYRTFYPASAIINYSKASSKGGWSAVVGHWWGGVG